MQSSCCYKRGGQCKELEEETLLERRLTPKAHARESRKAKAISLLLPSHSLLLLAFDFLCAVLPADKQTDRAPAAAAAAASASRAELRPRPRSPPLEDEYKPGQDDSFNTA